jgi:hypothetical protein
MSFTAKERVALTRAFQRAWKAFLAEERITAQNIERAPTLLVEAIVDAAHMGERNEVNLAAAAIARMTLYEQDHLKGGMPLH